MGKTVIYFLGMLALAFTNFGHAQAFYSLVLPIIDLFFIIFLGFELIFYFSILGFSKNEYNAYDLWRDIIDLRSDIAQSGLLDAATTLAISLGDFLLLFVAIVYALGRIIELAAV